MDQLESQQKEDSDTKPLKLKKEFGLFYGVTVIVGLIMGGGIFITPQNVLKHAQSPGLSLVIWFLAGFISFCGALCYAEIGVTYPVSGEKYAYLTKLYSPILGFVYFWQYVMFIRPSMNSLKMYLFASFFLKPFFVECKIPQLLIFLLALTFAVVICFINCMSVKLVAKLQGFMTIITLLTISTICFLGLYSISLGNVQNLRDPFKDSAISFDSIVLSFYSAFFAFVGWSALNFIIDEVKNPEKTLPRAIIISTLSLTILYFLTNLSYMAILNEREFITSEAPAISVCMKFSIKIVWFLIFGISMTSCASFNSGLLVGSRMTFTASKSNQFPRIFSFIHVNRLTPVPSILFQLFLIVFYLWYLDIEFFVNNLTFAFIFWDVFVVGKFLYNKLRDENKQKVYNLKVPIVIYVIYLITSVFLTIISLMNNPKETCSIFFVSVISSFIYFIPMYFATSYFKNVQLLHEIQYIVQKFLLVSPEE